MALQKWSESIWIFKPGEEPGLSDEMVGLMSQIRAAGPTPSLVVDLTDVGHLNSSNLSQLLRLRKQAAEGSARMLVTGMPNAVWSVFLTTGLDKVFEFAPDVPMALATLQLT